MHRGRQMQVAIHAGAHSTEEGRLLKSLLSDTGRLRENGVAVPEPAAFRTALKDSFAGFDAGGTPAAAGEALWHRILGSSGAERAVLSNPHFFGSQRHALDGPRLYPDAARRLLQLQALFPGDGLELFLCIRNPAAFLPAVLEKAGAPRVRSVLQESDPMQLRWSAALQDIRAALPGLPVTVWCCEDLPFIWEDVLQALTGLGGGFRFSGALDMARAIMSREGGKRLAAYMADQPEMSSAQKIRVFSTFLDKFAREDALEEELDLPGWTEGLVAQLTGLYEADLDTIAAIPGVTLIEPAAH